MKSAEAERYLKSLLGRKLHLHMTDSRMFVGDFKCTDNVRPQVAVTLFATSDNGRRNKTSS